MLEEYIAVAIGQATCEYLSEDEIYYCEVCNLPGVWGTGETRDSAIEDLRSVIEDWVNVGLDRD